MSVITDKVDQVVDAIAEGLEKFDDAWHSGTETVDVKIHDVIAWVLSLRTTPKPAQEHVFAAAAPLSAACKATAEDTTAKLQSIAAGS